MRKPGKELLGRSGVVFGTVLVLTLVAIGAAQFLQVCRIMSRFETAVRVRLAVTGFLTMTSVLLLAFAGLSVWIGRLVSRYVAERDRQRLAKDMELAAGITEQENEAKELFGESRLREILVETRATWRRLLDFVSRSVVRFAGAAEQTDDRTQLELVWRGPPVRTFHEYAPTMEGLARASADLDADLGDAVPFEMKMTILTAADEIFVNIIRHSGATRWSLAVERAAFPKEIRLVFEDDGRPFDPLAFKDPDTSIAIEDRAEGGLGIFIVKKTMSPVTYVRRDGRNVLTLGKTLEAPAEAIELSEKTLSERKIVPRRRVAFE